MTELSADVMISLAIEEVGSQQGTVGRLHHEIRGLLVHVSGSLEEVVQCCSGQAHGRR